MQKFDSRLYSISIIYNSGSKRITINRTFMQSIINRFLALAAILAFPFSNYLNYKYCGNSTLNNVMITFVFIGAIVSWAKYKYEKTKITKEQLKEIIDNM